MLWQSGRWTTRCPSRERPAASLQAMWPADSFLLLATSGPLICGSHLHPAVCPPQGSLPPVPEPSRQHFFRALQQVAQSFVRPESQLDFSLSPIFPPSFHSEQLAPQTLVSLSTSRERNLQRVFSMHILSRSVYHKSQENAVRAHLLASSRYLRASTLFRIQTSLYLMKERNISRFLPALSYLVHRRGHNYC